MDTHELGLDSVPEHHPFSDRGHKSVIFTTMKLVTGGVKGGVAMIGCRSVKLKHLPQAGP
jgi:hypothetical protein